MLVRELVERIREISPATIREIEGTEEHIVFPIPKALQGAA